MNKNNDKQQNKKSSDNSDFTKKTQKKKAGAKKEARNEFDFIEDIEDKIRNGIKRLSEINLKKLDIGALFVGIERLRKSITVIDTRVSNYVNDLSSKAVDMVNTSIKNFKKNRYS
ncbi:hypothetical protein ACFL4Z_01320 [candidate division KSB1 bacterium]